VPPEFRLVLVLSVVEGSACKEIAEIVAIAIGTVVSSLLRGRKLLQASLHESAPERGLVQD